MTTFNNLRTTEPAFVSYEKSVRRSARGSHRCLNDCCFSFSNLALIVASIVALIYSSKFLSDDVLYEYFEHLFSLRFYRQLVFIIVILPLVLIVPAFNAISAFFLSDRHRFELGSSLTVVKLIYQVILALLVLVGLIFVAPNIRQTSVSSQLGYELRRHMKLRYDNQFSYILLDRIQAEYECCDESWYVANYSETKLPLTCFIQNGSYLNIYAETCAEVLGSIVSTRCAIIAACLLIILVALAILIVIDLLEVLTISSQQYDVGSQESRLTSNQFNEESHQTNREHKTEQVAESSFPRQNLTNDHRDLVEELNNRLRSSERLRETPLLASNRLGEEEEQRQPTPVSYQAGQSPILTRANYLYNNNSRPQSPFLFKVDSPEPPTGSVSPSQSVKKGVLKKTGSFQRVYPSEDEDDHNEESDDDLNGHNMRDYQRQQTRRDLQNRRSLLNVRFAD